MPVFYTGGAVLAMIVVFALFVGTALYFVMTATVAPGVLVTTLLFKLLSKEFIRSDLWTSSIIFSIIIILVMRHYKPQKYVKYYCTLILSISLCLGFYNIYINHDNAVMFTVNAMHFGNNSAMKTTPQGSETAVIIGENVNLRNIPSQSSTVINTLSSGERITVKKESSAWYFVRVNNTGEEGWVHRDYVKNL